MIEIKKADIVALAVKPEQYPPADLPEVAFAGRSNVGKSSLLNYLTNRRKLARVSSAPGKTRTINFYLCNDNFRIVDLPGYGYAKISRSESEKWGTMMESFLENRECLSKVFLLVDSRHAPSKQDVQMYEYLKYYNLDGPVIATKFDKISKNELFKNMQIIRKTLGMNSDAKVIPVSAFKKTGKEEILSEIEALINLV